MIRIFKVYYPARTLILLLGEALIVCTSFLLATVLQHPNDSYIVLNYENGYLKIFILTGVVLLLSHWCDLYDPIHFDSRTTRSPARDRRASARAASSVGAIDWPARAAPRRRSR